MRILGFLALALAAAPGALHGQSSVRDQPLGRLSPWVGLGFGTGNVTAPDVGLEAGPSYAGRLDAGLEVASTFRLSVEQYGQAGSILEDSQNSASFRTVKAGVRVLSHFIFEAGLGTGRYTSNNSRIGENPSAREVGVEIVRGPHAIDTGLYLQSYTTRLGPTSASPDRLRLRGFVVGGAVQLHLLDMMVGTNQ